MKFQEINIDQLNSFIKSDLYKNSINIPITEQRAISQLNNPRANKNDIALIIAINNKNQIVGFIGTLPDYFYKTKTKVYWISCWWIDKEKGKQTAIPLFLKLLKACDNKLMFRDMTAKTKQIIERLNQFQKSKNLNGYRYFIRLNSEAVITRKYKASLHIKPVFKLIDSVFNGFLSLKNNSFKEKNNNTKKVEFIDDETRKFIKALNTNELFKREETELNWIINFPWVLEKSLKKNSQYYYFTDTSKHFKNEILKVYNLDKLIGIIFFTNNNGLVKIPYIYFENQEIKHITQTIYLYLKETKAISFLTYNNSINTFIQSNKNPFWYKKEDKREFMISKSLTQYTNWEYDFQDGESDFVFT